MLGQLHCTARCGRVIKMVGPGVVIGHKLSYSRPFSSQVAGSEASTNGDLTWRSSVDSEAGLAPGSSGSVTRDASSGSGRPWWRRRPQAEAPGPPGALARERGGRGSKCLPVWRRGRREREGSDVGVDVAATGARV